MQDIEREESNFLQLKKQTVFHKVKTVENIHIIRALSPFSEPFNKKAKAQRTQDKNRGFTVKDCSKTF